MKRIILLAVLFFGAMAFAEIIPPAPDATPVVIQKIDAIDKAIPTEIAAWVLGLIGVAIELLMRLVPTAKPRSVLILISSGLAGLGSIFSKLSALLDKVVQNVKSE